MSYLTRIERPAEVDYLTRLAAKTRRDDAELIARHGALRATEADSARLLSALLECWPDDNFDESNVAAAAPYRRPLMAALDFIGPRVGQRGGGRRLSPLNERDTWRWILDVTGREIGGMRLMRDPIGWCRVEIAARAGASIDRPIGDISKTVRAEGT